MTIGRDGHKISKRLRELDYVTFILALATKSSVPRSTVLRLPIHPQQPLPCDNIDSQTLLS
ncbi:hypothetical protein [Chamaesiphon sp. GL140_3_metabinner_50]|uniref:hypothetical protein n=1 Tax=Chamaesiphon sp. GL140_3_metabinner_50 TaxID=2970812 RepID=UPI0025EDB290|nr:hypothetical protein [Chamaesiphon sp. GL140_3_metabinner_50]